MPIRQEKEKLKFLRQEIHALDERIIELIYRRAQISQEIGKVKKKLNLPVENLDQEKRVLKAGLDLAESLDLNANSIETFLKNLIKLCKERQIEQLSQTFV